MTALPHHRNDTTSTELRDYVATVLAWNDVHGNPASINVHIDVPTMEQANAIARTVPTRCRLHARFQPATGRGSLVASPEPKTALGLYRLNRILALVKSWEYVVTEHPQCTPPSQFDQLIDPRR